MKKEVESDVEVPPKEASKFAQYRKLNKAKNDKSDRARQQRRARWADASMSGDPTLEEFAPQWAKKQAKGGGGEDEEEEEDAEEDAEDEDEGDDEEEEGGGNASPRQIRGGEGLPKKSPPSPDLAV